MYTQKLKLLIKSIQSHISYLIYYTCKTNSVSTYNINNGYSYFFSSLFYLFIR